MDPHVVLADQVHRPWPAPRKPWVMTQSWHELLFAHWPMEPASVQERVPYPLEVDTYEGQAWLGVVPFRMSGVRRRGLPALPGTSSFEELNVRTYVRFGDKRGVYFFSLDAKSKLAVEVARRWFKLPYYHARMSLRHPGSGEEVQYSSLRIHEGAPEARLEASYAPSGPVARANQGSLEHFLTERYCLLTLRKGQVLCGDIHHAAWPLRPAEAEFRVNTMAKASVLELPDTKPLLHYAKRLDVIIWPLEAMGGPRRA